jgi:hypothetical protein
MHALLVESVGAVRHSHGVPAAQSVSLKQVSYEQTKSRKGAALWPQRPFEPSVQSES